MWDVTVKRPIYNYSTMKEEIIDYKRTYADEVVLMMVAELIMAGYTDIKMKKQE